MVTPSVRLVPRWYAGVVIGALTLVLLGFIALALSVDGVLRWSA